MSLCARSPRVLLTLLLAVLSLTACEPQKVSNPQDAGRDPLAAGGATAGRGGTAGSGSRTGTGGKPGAGGLSGSGGGADAASMKLPDSAPDLAPPPDRPADAAADRAVDAATADAASDRTGDADGRIFDPHVVPDNENDGMHPFVMPWGDHSPGPADMSGLNDPATMSRISVSTDGHLARDGRRYRLFGTNLTFEACIPSREQADALAARLAKVGYNAVRLHHCDSYWGWPRLLDYSNNRGTISEKNLDRYFYLVAALKKRGIYVDVNLLVSRRFLPGDSDDATAPLPFNPIAPGEDWNEESMQQEKAVGFFYDPVMMVQQRFAKDLLTRTNPYTGLTLAEDPASADGCRKATRRRRIASMPSRPPPRARAPAIPARPGGYRREQRGRYAGQRARER